VGAAPGLRRVAIGDALELQQRLPAMQACALHFEAHQAVAQVYFAQLEKTVGLLGLDGDLEFSS